MRARVAALALAAAALLAGQALAQGAGDTTLAPLVGTWQFETTRYHDGECQLTGSMRVRRAPNQPGGVTCALTAREVCPAWGRSYTAEQTCTLTRRGAEVTIDSTVVRVQPSTASYWPDDFNLRIVSRDLMRGDLRSAANAPAEFRRAPAAPTS